MLSLFLSICFLSENINGVTCADSLYLDSKGPYEIQDSVLTYYMYEFNFNTSLPNNGPCSSTNSSCTFYRVYNEATCVCFGTNEGVNETTCIPHTDPTLGEGVVFNFSSPYTAGYNALVYVYPGNQASYTVSNPASLPQVVMFSYGSKTPFLCQDDKCCNDLAFDVCIASASCYWDSSSSLCVYDECFGWVPGDPNGCPPQCVGQEFHEYRKESNGTVFFYDEPWCVNERYNPNPNLCEALMGANCTYVAGCNPVTMEVWGERREMCVLDGIMAPSYSEDSATGIGKAYGKKK